MDDIFDPFDDINETTKSETFLKDNNDIEIWIENRGRKTDTYMSGLPYDDITLKEHVKIIKKKKGCNGTIKFIEKENEKIKVLHLQGNQKNMLLEYFTNIGLENIKLKG